MIYALIALFVTTIIAVLFALSAMIEEKKAVEEDKSWWEKTWDYLEETWDDWWDGEDQNDASGGTEDQEYDEESAVNGHVDPGDEDYWAGNGDSYNDSTYA